MRRLFIWAVVALIALACGTVRARADEYFGKIMGLDRDRMTVKLSVPSLDKKPLQCTSRTMFVDEGGRAIKAGIDSSLLMEGVEVSVTTEFQGGRLFIKRLKLGK
jgi:hypothetical protein